MASPFEAADGQGSHISHHHKAGAVKIQNLRGSVALLQVLDTDLGGIHGARVSWWINQVRTSLAAIGGAERRAWERLVLSMTVSERMVLPETLTAKPSRLSTASDPSASLAGWRHGGHSRPACRCMGRARSC
jgi:hypothetical protein